MCTSDGTDGGIPDGRHGPLLSPATRIVQITEQAMLAHALGAVPRQR